MLRDLTFFLAPSSELKSAMANTVHSKGAEKPTRVRKVRLAAAETHLLEAVTFAKAILVF